MMAYNSAVDVLSRMCKHWLSPSTTLQKHSLDRVLGIHSVVVSAYSMLTAPGLTNTEKKKTEIANKPPMPSISHTALPNNHTWALMATT